MMVFPRKTLSCLEDAADEAEVKDGEDLDTADDAEDIVELITNPIGFKAFAIDIDLGGAPELDTKVELTTYALTGYGAAKAKPQVGAEA